MKWLRSYLHGCLCGYATDPKRDYTCTAQQIQRYTARVSGPLLDRIDIHIEVTPVSYAELAGPPDGETSAVIRARVNVARRRTTAFAKWRGRLRIWMVRRGLQRRIWRRRFSIARSTASNRS